MDLEANRHQHKYKVKVILILIRSKRTYIRLLSNENFTIPCELCPNLSIF